MRRRIRALKRQITSYEDCLLELSGHPRCGAEIRSAFLAAYIPLRDEPDDLKRFDRCTGFASPTC